ncbi:MAG: hypothetical protein U5L09_17535 [Bacteroidales bacterium]|nr:hypothetical protein [Bacteroidales bacterium]
MWDSAALTLPGQVAQGQFLAPDSVNSQDTIDLPYEFPDEDGLHFEDDLISPLFMKDPSNISTEIIYDPETNEYIFQDKVGSIRYRNPSSLTFEQYQQKQMDNTLRSYWLERSRANNLRDRDGTFPQIEVGSEAFEQIFGGNTIDIRPQGTAKVDFGVVSN